MDRDMLLEVARAYLREKHVTLWMNWDIVRPGGLEEAANWLVDEWMRFNTALAGEMRLHPTIWGVPLPLVDVP